MRKWRLRDMHQNPIFSAMKQNLKRNTLSELNFSCDLKGNFMWSEAKSFMQSKVKSTDFVQNWQGEHKIYFFQKQGAHNFPSEANFFFSQQLTIQIWHLTRYRYFGFIRHSCLKVVRKKVLDIGPVVSVLFQCSKQAIN